MPVSDTLHKWILLSEDEKTSLQDDILRIKKLQANYSKLSPKKMLRLTELMSFRRNDLCRLAVVGLEALDKGYLAGTIGAEDQM